MFNELEKYENNGHFLYKRGQKLKVESREVPELPGVYYLLKMTKNDIEVVYIGKSGSINMDGTFKSQGLRGRINNKQNIKEKRQVFLERKFEEDDFLALDIFWFVTFDNDTKELPGYVEGLLIQKFFEMHGRLPKWNNEF